MYITISDGQFVQKEPCKCYTVDYRCEPHTERVSTCGLTRRRPGEVVCCKVRNTKDKGKTRKQQLETERNKLRDRKRSKANKSKLSRQIHTIQDLLNMLINRRPVTYVW